MNTDLWLDLVLAQNPQCGDTLKIFAGRPYRHDMVMILSAVVSIFAFRFRSRASLELELIALQHQLAVLRRPASLWRTLPI